jgi:hypothetical protein
LYFAVWPDGQAGLQDYVERADVILARARVLKLDSELDSAQLSRYGGNAMTISRGQWPPAANVL